MQFEFDPQKDAINLSKHGLSLAVAVQINWDAALVWIDDRADYGEMRMVALAPMEVTLLYVAFVDRESVRRIISLRRANRREVNYYVKTIETDQSEDSDI